MLSLNAVLVFAQGHFGLVAAHKRAVGNHVCPMCLEACYHQDDEAQ